MKTVGIMLKGARLAKGWSLEEVERATKIRLKFLQAIEEDDYSQLPSQAYAKGFVKNYSEFLGLPSGDVLAFFRRQTRDVPRSSLLPKGMSEPLNASGLRLTPGRFVGLLVFSLIVAFLVYFGVQYQRLRSAPALLIATPQNQLITSQRRIEVQGKTDPEATVTINGVSVLVRSDGRFFDSVMLEPGVNRITVAATSRFGKTTTVVREIGFQQP